MVFERSAYPAARRVDLTEDISGYQVSDPYRWLENPESAESAAWLESEGALWAAARAELGRRTEFAERVAELMHVGEVGAPAWRGDRQFFTRRDPGQDHGVLYVADEAGERALVDPTALDPSGRTTLDDWQPDKEGRLLAYQVSTGGNEESVLYVLDVATGDIVDGPIDRCRYSPVAWLPGGKAFYYTRRLDPALVPGEEQYHRRVYLHQVGEDPSSDAEVFGAGRDKTSYYSPAVSRDGRWLVLQARVGTEPRSDVWIADLSASDPAAPEFAEVVTGRDASTYAYVASDGRLYVFTDLDAPRGRLCVADPAQPGPDGWRDLLPQDGTAVLRDYALLDNVLVAAWTRHALGLVTVHSLATGEKIRELPLPGPGTVAGVTARPEGQHEAWITYTDYGTPSTVLRYDDRDGSVSVWATAPGGTDLPEVTAEQVSYTSADGTQVRMVVLRAPGAAPGPRPAILYGYGGFDISLTPGYSANILAWIESGGVYAVAGLRGGSEEGEEWHRAGMRERKQNVFDDFHAAASWLIASGLTSRDQLAIWGGSNGGLLIGAAVTQRPDLYAAAVCSAPLLDMVRYERFGLGQLWSDEYGTASDPVELGWLLGYSPYHHVVDGTSYPAVLFTIFTNDTRVDPVHAYKMCAALQHATASGKPVLMRAEGEVGHGARAVRFAAELAGDALAFVAQQTGAGSS
jgi:prolyl oligopeptidase